MGSLLIGTGNAWRGDDAAGLVIARSLRGRLPPTVRIFELDGETTELMEAWQGHDVVVVVDAVTAGAEAGTIHRFDATHRPLPAEMVTASTHGLGIAEAVELARTLGRLPRRLILYGIEGRDFTTGRGLSPVVERAVEAAAARVIVELAPGGSTPARQRPSATEDSACTNTRS